MEFKYHKKTVRKPKNKQKSYKYIFEMKQNESQQQPQPSTNDNELQMLASHLINNAMSKEQKKQQIHKLVKEFVDEASANVNDGHQDCMFYTHTNHIHIIFISMHIYIYGCKLNVTSNAPHPHYSRKWSSIVTTITANTAHYEVSLTQQDMYHLKIKKKNQKTQ